MVGDTSKKTPEPRVVFIKKSQLELGVHLCGGNLHGVFVAEMEDDSPAKGPDGLVPGDLILEVSSELLNSSPCPTSCACQASAWALASRGKMFCSRQQQDFWSGGGYHLLLTGSHLIRELGVRY